MNRYKVDRAVENPSPGSERKKTGAEAGFRWNRAQNASAGGAPRVLAHQPAVQGCEPREDEPREPHDGEDRERERHAQAVVIEDELRDDVEVDAQAEREWNHARDQEHARDV